MNTSKNMVRGIAALALCLVVFLVLAFAIPFAKTGAYVVSLIFGIVAILAAGAGTYLAFKDGTDAKSRFYGFPIAKLAVVYGIAQIVISLIFMALAKFTPAWIPALIDVILLAAACIGMIAADAAREEITQQDDAQKKNTENMLALRSKANVLVGLTDDKAISGQLQALADKFRYSDPVGSSATENLDDALFALLDELQKALVENDAESVPTLCRRTEAQLAERNRICKLNK